MRQDDLTRLVQQQHQDATLGVRRFGWCPFSPQGVVKSLGKDLQGACRTSEFGITAGAIDVKHRLVCSLFCVQKCTTGHF
jgi:hypothetical protein